jgi:hypothetical protein
MIIGFELGSFLNLDQLGSVGSAAIAAAIVAACAFSSIVIVWLLSNRRSSAG